MENKKIIVGITGASGTMYGLTLLNVLQKIDVVETHLVISDAGKKYLFHGEIGENALERAVSAADFTYDIDDISAPIASGSFKIEGMIVAPCSAKTLSSIARSYGDNLITRASDVVLKERRKLVLLFRETPLHLGHIENMAQVTRMGGIIMPPMPAFYSKPSTIEDIIMHSVGRALDLFSIDHTLFKRWGGFKE